MMRFIKQPDLILETNYHPIYVFTSKENDHNIDYNVVQAFGEEWSKFNSFSDKEIEKLGDSYFDILDEEIINKSSCMIDFGAGSARFSKYLSDKVKFIDVLEPSNAVFAASNLLRDVNNVRITKASIGSAPYEDGAYDFGMSIGVLHHIPDTQSGLAQCIKKIKPDGWFYVYFYYNLDNKGFLFKTLFGIVNLFRIAISRLPFGIKNIACDFMAIILYMPIILLGRIFNFFGFKNFAKKFPLNYYQNQSFRIIRNDALDRFGTRLEKRFSKVEIEEMMKACGLSNIRISSQEPYWHAVGQKTTSP